MFVYEYPILVQTNNSKDEKYNTPGYRISAYM